MFTLRLLLVLALLFSFGHRVATHDGNGFDPHGGRVTTDEGNGFDPHGKP